MRHRLADHLRHVQERGEGDHHRFVTARSQVGREERAVGAVMKRPACLLLALFVSAIASAQVRESVSVEVVQVPVYVSTHNGVVTGLTRDNFRLFVNGKSQAIDYFDVVDFSAISAPEGQRPDPRQRRLYLLVFDLLFSTPNAIARAQVAVDRLLTKAGLSDEFSVATYRHNRGVELLVPFTR